MCMPKTPNIPEQPPPPKAASPADVLAAARLRAKKKSDTNTGRKSTMLTGPRGAATPPQARGY